MTLRQAPETLADTVLDSLSDLVPGAGVAVRSVRSVANLVDDDDRPGYDPDADWTVDHAHVWTYAERLEGFDVLLSCGCGELLRKTIPVAKPEPEPDGESRLRGALLAVARDAEIGVARRDEPTASRTIRFERIRDQARAVLEP